LVEVREKNREYYNAFYYLIRKGYLQIERRGRRIPVKKELKMLREFFGLSNKEFILITGVIPEYTFLRKIFKL